MQAKEDIKKYAWSYKDGMMTCCTSETSSCNVSKLWEVTGLTTFHDAALQHATKEINGILDGVRRRNRDRTRELGLVQVGDRHLLVWATERLVGPHSDDRTLRKTLRLKAR